jgi:hypothetical protein
MTLRREQPETFAYTDAATAASVTCRYASVVSEDKSPLLASGKCSAIVCQMTRRRVQGLRRRGVEAIVWLSWLQGKESKSTPKRFAAGMSRRSRKAKGGMTADAGGYRWRVLWFRPPG